MKALNSFMVLVVFSGTMFSQSKRSVSFEAGGVFNTMLDQKASVSEIEKNQLYDYTGGGCVMYKVMPYYTKEEVVGDGLQKSGQDYRFYHTTGFYFKLNYEKSIYTKRNFYITLPLGLVWLNETDRFTKYNWYEGGGLNYHAENTFNLKNNMLNLRLGVSLNYQYRAVQFYWSMLYHTGLYNQYSMKQEHVDGNNQYSNTYSANTNNMHGYVAHIGYYSGSIGANFYLKKNWSMGPCVEVYFAKEIRDIFYTPFRPSASYSSYMLGLQGKNVWINPGLRMQFSF